MSKAQEPKQMNNMGFTLLELMFVIAIIGVLAIVGVPKYGAIKENYNLEGAAQKAVSQLNVGRQMAIDQRGSVYIVFKQHQVAVYQKQGNSLTLASPALPYEGGVSFSTAANSWLYPVHQDPDNSGSALLGHGVSYDFRGFLEKPAQGGVIRLQSQGGQKVCILIGEGTGRIEIDQCEDNP